MLPPVTRQIEPAVARFLFSGGTLRDLRLATIPAIHEVDEQDEPALQDLADELTLRFAEDDHGDWTEAELREQLHAYLQEQWPDLHARLRSLATVAAGTATTR